MDNLAVSQAGELVVPGLPLRTPLHKAFRFVRRQPIGAFSLLILLLLCAAAILAPYLAPFDPNANNVGPSLIGPSSNNLFGTDQFGRDIFSRVIYGGRISLVVGLGSTLLASLIATIVGATSGYFGGKYDYLVQRLVDVSQALPGLVLLIVFVIILGPGMLNLIVALAVRGGISISRVVRGAVISLRSLSYIEAARAIGASEARIVMAHILPNILPTILILTSINIGANIVAEASLSFLGYGVPPPAPSWGGMMSADGRIYMIVNPWILIFPTLVLALAVYSFNMFGDALRDEIDPRLRGAR